MAELLETVHGEATLWTAVDADGSTLGYVAVDSLVQGRACGGLRLLPRLEAADMLALAAAMTLKFGLLGLPQGGAKAGVIGDPEAAPALRQARLAAFARAIAPLLADHRYVPCSDMGTSGADIRAMLAAVGLPPPRRALRGTNSGVFTAASVAAAASAVAVASRPGGLVGLTAAVEGFGSVGANLAAMLVQAGVRVVAVSTSRGALYDVAGLDVLALRELAARLGSAVVDQYEQAQRLDRAELLTLPVDLLCPCGQGKSITVDNADAIQAKLICPGANLAVDQASEARLIGRGVLCVPDFVANSGGVLGGTMEFAGLGRDYTVDIIHRYTRQAVELLLERARREEILPSQLAANLARARHRQLAGQLANPTPSGRLAALGLAGYRAGLVPAFAIRPLTRRYFRRRLDGLLAALRG